MTPNEPSPDPVIGYALITSSATLQKCARPVVGSAAVGVPSKRVKASDPPNATAPPIRTTISANANPARTIAARARAHHSQEKDLSSETDKSAARVGHDQRHTHQHRDKRVEDALLLLNRTGKQQAQRQSD